MRRAAKRDLAEPPIIDALERVGAHVYPLDYPVDLLVRFRERWHLLEIKSKRDKSGVARIDPRQIAQRNFIESTQTPIVTTPLEALRAIGAV
jgi:hypothetical protein